MDPALVWARRLAHELVPEARLPLETPGESASAAWARSGALWLTGPADAPPVLPRVALPSCMDGALAVLRALAPEADLAEVEGAALLGERAALAALRRGGRVSPGGSARLLWASDGCLVANLPREEDRRSLPAWLGTDPARPSDADWWPAVTAAVRGRSVSELVDRAHLLGLAVAGVTREPAPVDAAWMRVADRGAAGRPVPERPLVVDLSSLWAGPLCADLLRRCGATVWKVESLRRPDGARAGPAAFFDLLNGGKACIALDFTESSGLAALHRLVAHADVVIEASRPRALEQLGLDAAAWLGARPGRVWLSLTAYGLDESGRDRIGFGDDVAAAAGLAWSVPGAPLFVADAPADPLAAVHAAVAVLATLRDGESRRLDVSLHAVMAAACTTASDASDGPAPPARLPRARIPRQTAHALGADTAEVLAGLSV